MFCHPNEFSSNRGRLSQSKLIVKYYLIAAYRKTTKRKEILEPFNLLKEDELNFIKPYAFKWKNNSIFSVLMRYRGIKLEDFFSFSQQVIDMFGVHKSYISVKILFLGTFIQCKRLS